MTTIVTIDMGGTGATHAAGAREALSVPSMTEMGAAYAQANAAYAQANSAFNGANNARVTVFANNGSANVTTQNINFLNTSTILVTVANTSGNGDVTFSLNGTPYDQANTARNTANDAYSQANAAYDQANGAYGQANTARSDANTTFGTINSTFGTINTNYQAAYAQANVARTTANDAYATANTKLGTSGGSISGDLTISGNLTVQGNATTINVSNLSVNDSIILLSANSTGDAEDIGFIGHITRDSTNTHVGLIRKATENRFYLFDNYEVEPTNNVIDITGNNFRVGNIRLGIINANSFVTAAGLDVTGQANAAYGQANTAYGQANLAYAQANSARSDANTTFATINTTFGTTNTTFATINSTFATLNTADSNRVLKAGDTMTGALNIQADAGNEQLVIKRSSNANQQLIFGFHSSNYGSIQSIEQNVAFRPLALNRDGGNVGVGLTNPYARLHVTGGSIGQSTTDFAANSAGTVVYMRTGASTGNTYGLIQAANTGDTVGTSLVLNQFGGNVGIGTTNPLSKLHISGDDGAIYIDRTNGNPFVFFGVNGDFANTAAIYGATDGLRFYAGVSTPQRMYINASGNVGIGTTNPAYKFQIEAGGDHLALSRSGFAVQLLGVGTVSGINGLHLTDATNSKTPVSIAQNAPTGSLVLTDTGNVGIGTTNPSRPLHVNGIMQWGGGSSAPYTYSGIDNLGVYIEHVDDNSGKARIRLQTRVNNSGNYVQFTVDAVNGQITSTHSILPSVDNSINLGSSSYRWANIYTADLNMSNKGSQNDVDGTWGEWTIQEGEEDLFLLNRRNGKKYKFLLKEIE